MCLSNILFTIELNEPHQKYFDTPEEKAMLGIQGIEDSPEFCRITIDKYVSSW